MAKIAFLGTGAMGERMAANLLKHNHEVCVWNRTKEKTDALQKMGARVAETPREAVANVEFAISMVRDDAAAREVWLDETTGALAGLPSNAIAVESSTVTPDWARELATNCAQRNVGFLDAPVSGSRPQAEAAQLIFIVGGASATFAAAEPVLKTMGATVNHIGEAAGSGAILKLAVNELLGVQVAAAAEIIGFLQKTGIDLKKAADLITTTPVCSPYLKVAIGTMLAGNFAPLFTTELVEKDLAYIDQTAASNRAEMPLAKAAREVFRQAIEAGQADENLTSTVKLYR